MKLTKNQLRQLIKEELLNEFDPLNLYPDKPSLTSEPHGDVMRRATAKEKQKQREEEVKRLALDIHQQLKHISGATITELILYLYAIAGVKPPEEVMTSHSRARG
jgi:hypothetical protein